MQKGQLVLCTFCIFIPGKAIIKLNSTLIESAKVFSFAFALIHFIGCTLLIKDLAYRFVTKKNCSIHILTGKNLYKLRAWSNLQKKMNI